MPYTLNILLIILAVTMLSLVISIILSVLFLKNNKNGRLKLSHHLLLTLFYTIAVSGLIFSIFYGIRLLSSGDSQLSTNPTGTVAPTQGSSHSDSPTTQEPTQPSTELPTEPPTEPAEPEFTLPAVGMTEDSDPDNWDVKWEIIVDGEITDSYTREESISFADANKYSYASLPGVFTFRGDNYRTGPVWGTADVQQEVLSDLWVREIGSLNKGTGTGAWTGCGWTGQPLIVQWDEETKAIMNLYPEKKAKENLVEVIYATMDGYIYFYDLDDGTYTRPPMNVGMTFKGAGALDPRGYPILYVGAGDKTASGKIQRMYIINLIDCTIAFEYGNGDDWRKRNWTAFDSSPLVSAETDTLIWPGESGILYTMKLNTVYDKEAGTLSIAPDNIVRTRYSTSTGRTLGYEASVIAVDHYLYVADNGGMLFCVDVNTMELMWAQNVRDDVNATPVFEWDAEGNGWLYIGTSMEYCGGSVYMYKINASTGEIAWEVHIDGVAYDKAVSGGILSSPVLGKQGTALEGMIYWSIARTPGNYSGTLLALDTDTGEVIWESVLSSYCWSSPLAVYSESGEPYLILCDSVGNVMLIDALNGETLNKLNIGSNIEASPAMFNDILVVGTRGQRVHGIKLN